MGMRVAGEGAARQHAERPRVQDVRWAGHGGLPGVPSDARGSRRPLGTTGSMI